LTSVSLPDIADYIGRNVPAILQQKNLSAGGQVSAPSGGLPLIIQQLLENVVKWANTDQRPKYEVCRPLSCAKFLAIP
jgi:hypothetical protein